MSTKSIDNTRAHQYSQLRCLMQGKWKPLPVWVEFLLEVGSSLANFDKLNQRYVAAVALPTRSFAASFVGSGIAYSHANLLADVKQSHLNLILSLPPNTPVRYLDKNGRLKKAHKREIVVHDNRTLIGLLIETDGNTTIYVDSENAHRIEVSSKNHNSLPMHQKGRTVCPPSPLVEELLSGKGYDYVFQTRIEGIMVGSFNALKQEAQMLLAIEGEDGTMHQGYLHELLRLKGLNPASTGYRFVMRPSGIYERVGLADNSIASCSTIIFDGAISFLKWKEAFPNHNWIVILDHTEPNFPNAVSQVNQDYINRSEAPIGLPTFLPPLGIEMILFGRDI